MKKFLHLFVFLLLSLAASSITKASSEEEKLIKLCLDNISSCESMATKYMEQKQWRKALIISEALCKNEIILGCTLKGSILLANKKNQEASITLNDACDKFEPYACRSLGRLMKKGENKDLSHVYFRRACYFGLDEVCKDLQKDRKILSSGADEFLKSIKSACQETVSTSCQEKIKLISQCGPPLTSQDCLLLPGLLSIFLKARLIQSQAKVLLTWLHLQQKKFKSSIKNNKFSNNLKELINKDQSHLSPHYVYGFQENCSSENKNYSLHLFPDEYKQFNEIQRQKIKREFNGQKKQDCYDPKWGFEIFAITSLDPLNPDLLDIWKINQDGNLVHLQDGTINLF